MQLIYIIHIYITSHRVLLLKHPYLMLAEGELSIGVVAGSHSDPCLPGSGTDLQARSSRGKSEQVLAALLGCVIIQGLIFESTGTLQ